MQQLFYILIWKYFSAEGFTNKKTKVDNIKYCQIRVLNIFASSLVNMSNEGHADSWRGQEPEPPPPPDEEGEQEQQQGGQVRQHPPGD